MGPKARRLYPTDCLLCRSPRSCWCRRLCQVAVLLAAAQALLPARTLLPAYGPQYVLVRPEGAGKALLTPGAVPCRRGLSAGGKQRHREEEVNGVVRRPAPLWMPCCRRSVEGGCTKSARQRPRETYPAHCDTEQSGHLLQPVLSSQSSYRTKEIAAGLGSEYLWWPYTARSERAHTPASIFLLGVCAAQGEYGSMYTGLQGFQQLLGLAMFV